LISALQEIKELQHTAPKAGRLLVFDVKVVHMTYSRY